MGSAPAVVRSTAGCRPTHSPEAKQTAIMATATFQLSLSFMGVASMRGKCPLGKWQCQAYVHFRDRQEAGR
jgi:hypothetical protein